MYTLQLQKADSRRSIREYRIRKLFESRLAKVFIIITLPLYMLWRFADRNEASILFLISVPVLAMTTV